MHSIIHPTFIYMLTECQPGDATGSPNLRTTLRLAITVLALPWISVSMLSAQDAAPAQALRNVILHHHDGRVDSSATIVWRDGVIEAAGVDVRVPFDAFITDGGDSLHVYPGFIDGLNTWGSPKSDQPANASVGRSGGPGMAGGARAADPGNPSYERAGIQPERSSADLLAEDKTYTDALKSGFTAGNLVPAGRMLPGTSDLLINAGRRTPSSLISESTSVVFRLEPAAGGWTSRAYPSTDMAVMARLKQLLYDANALKDHLAYSKSSAGAQLPLAERDPALEALFPVLEGRVPVLFEAESPEDLQRFLMLQDEFGFSSILYASAHLSGMEPEIKRRGLAVFVSFDLPEKPSWMNGAAAAPADSSSASDAEAQEPEWKTKERDAFRSRQAAAWRESAEQIRRFLDEGIPVGYASMGKKPQAFASGIATLLKDGGLTEGELLNILTYATADILGASDRLGVIRAGAIANLVVLDKPFTQKGAAVQMTVANGNVHRN